MQLTNLLSLLAVSALLISCAAKPRYTDQHGRRTDTPSYVYQQPAAAPALAIPAPPPAAPVLPPPNQHSEWPRVYVTGNVTNTIYQTQVDAWDGSALTGRNAVSVQSPEMAQPVYGVITFRATTSVDPSAGAVSLLNLTITEADFPSAPDRADEFARGIREDYGNFVQVISVGSLEAALAANAEQTRAAGQLDNTPPEIVFSREPALLVLIDGDPVFRDIEGTTLQRVLNTKVLLLRDPQQRYHLRLLDGYLTAPELKAPWTIGEPPPGAALAEKEARESRQVDLLEADLPSGTDVTVSLSDGPPPKVYVSTRPTELIVFSGAPDYVPIPGTQLLYVTNTTANVFKLLSDQQNYLLLSGRWFRSASLEGPWQHVPGSALPGEFARIPDSSPKENVKASVPGTRQAREALIANGIPQTTPVRRESQMPPPEIDGLPQLELISGTPLHYVVNSGTPIIKVDEQSWYACHNGIWYVSTSVEGPWMVADAVPAVIYSIPASSPLHYVTYVRVYNSNDRVVYHGYTPGYLGTVVDSDAVVVYGTGYYYRPWVGSVWYGYPVTWGFGADPFWSPWTGWSYGFGFGWYWSYYPRYHYRYWACHPPRPWWGPYRYHAQYVSGRTPAHGPDGWAHTSANLYQRPTRTSLAAARLAAANRGAPDYARAYNSRTGTAVAGESARVNNVFQSPPGSRSVRPVLAPGSRAPDGSASQWRLGQGGEPPGGSWRPTRSIRVDPGQAQGARNRFEAPPSSSGESRRERAPSMGSGGGWNRQPVGPSPGGGGSGRQGRRER